MTPSAPPFVSGLLPIVSYSIVQPAPWPWLTMPLFCGPAKCWIVRYWMVTLDAWSFRPNATGWVFDPSMTAPGAPMNVSPSLGSIEALIE